MGGGGTPGAWFPAGEAGWRFSRGSSGRLSVGVDAGAPGAGGFSLRSCGAGAAPGVRGTSSTLSWAARRLTASLASRDLRSAVSDSEFQYPESSSI